MDDSRLYKKKDIADYLGISPKTFNRLLETGKGPQFLLIGTAVRFRAKDVQECKDVQEWLNNLQNKEELEN